MLDRDLAELYQVEVKALNQAVKRNIARFPVEFMFQLNNEDAMALRSQIVTLERGKGKHQKYLPYAFTEQVVAMLSAILRSDTAVKMSIQIIHAFVSMRKFIASNAQIFHRLDTLELKQSGTDKKIEQVLNALEAGDLKPKQGIFFDGQIFDAYKFISDLFRSAKKSIVIIDNYLDESVLNLVSKRRENIKVLFLTKTISKSLALDIKKFNEQYPTIEIQEFKNSHDRFIIIDDNTVYHFGASLKDLGKKWFAFSKMEIGAVEMLMKIDDVVSMEV